MTLNLYRFNHSTSDDWPVHAIEYAADIEPVCLTFFQICGRCMRHVLKIALLSCGTLFAFKHENVPQFVMTPQKHMILTSCTHIPSLVPWYSTPPCPSLIYNILLCRPSKSYDKVVQDLPLFQVFHKIFFSNLFWKSSTFSNFTGDHSPPLRQNVMVSMPAWHAGDLGSIPDRACHISGV